MFLRWRGPRPTPSPCWSSAATTVTGWRTRSFSAIRQVAGARSGTVRGGTASSLGLLDPREGGGWIRATTNAGQRGQRNDVRQGEDELIRDLQSHRLGDVLQRCGSSEEERGQPHAERFPSPKNDDRDCNEAAPRGHVLDEGAGLGDDERSTGQPT